MCCCNDPKRNCQKPENLKDKPEDCAPEQVRQCHGDAKEHPCTADGAKRPCDEGTTHARKNCDANRT